MPTAARGGCYLRVVQRAAAVWILLALGSVACESTQGSDTDSAAGEGGGSATPGSVLLLLDINPEPLCGIVGVTGVQLVARRVGCESPPPTPCTVPVDPPTLEGDAFSCPNTDPSTLLGVEVSQGGRYEVQTVITYTDLETEARCHALDADPEIIVPAEVVEAGAVRMLDDGDVPCP